MLVGGILRLSVARSGTYFAAMSRRKKRTRSCALCSAFSGAVSLAQSDLWLPVYATPKSSNTWRSCGLVTKPTDLTES